MRQHQTDQPLPEKEVPAFPLIQEQVPAGKDSSCRQRPFPKHCSIRTCARRSCTTAAHRFLNRPDSRNFFSELTERKRTARICPDRSPLRISFSGPAPSFRSRIPRTQRPQIPQPQALPGDPRASCPGRKSCRAARRRPTPQPPERSGKLFRGDLLQLSRCRSGTRASRNAVTASARSFPFQAA